MTPLDDTDDAPTAGIEQIAVEHTKKNQTQWRPLIAIATFVFCTWFFAPQVGTENY
jgi:hypothetical protein